LDAFNEQLEAAVLQFSRERDLEDDEGELELAGILDPLGVTLSATIPDPEGGANPVFIGDVSFAVTSAAPTATITQRTSSTVSGDDLASNNYKTVEGTTNPWSDHREWHVKRLFRRLRNHRRYNAEHVCGERDTPQDPGDQQHLQKLYVIGRRPARYS